MYDVLTQSKDVLHSSRHGGSMVIREIVWKQIMFYCLMSLFPFSLVPRSPEVQQHLIKLIKVDHQSIVKNMMSINVEGVYIICYIFYFNKYIIYNRSKIMPDANCTVL